MGIHTADPARTWFDVLRSAKRSGDRELERLARRELESIGIKVTITAPSKPKGAAR